MASPLASSAAPGGSSVIAMACTSSQARLAAGAASVASSMRAARGAYFETVNEKSPRVLWPSLPTAVHTAR